MSFLYRKNYLKSGVFFLLLLSLLFFSFGNPFSVSAQKVEELRAHIQESKKALQKIEQEIAQYQKELALVGSEKGTLEKAVRELDLSRNKLQAEIKETQKKIDIADAEIYALGKEIETTQEAIERNKKTLASTLQNIDHLSNSSLVEMLLSHKTLSDAWDTVEAYTQLSHSLQEEVFLLQGLKKQREEARIASEETKKILSSFETELSSERASLDTAKKEKDTLLSRTKNEEAEYKKLLQERINAQKEFEKQLLELESQLSFVLDPSSIPTAGKGVLRFPIDISFMNQCSSRFATFGNNYCITQYFGDTEFSRTGAYNGRGHNGVDFGTPIGTKIVSSLGGVVVETGDTDYHNGVRTACQSYGKWVLVRHGNGLSTLYAHLSSIAVSAGQRVETGQFLGNSGNTGFSTGPHLHFTVFASEGVNVVLLGDVKPVTSCGHERIPVAAHNVYLNPMDYLL
jgi:murein DD-endopeptidase MepM/ murein hydrolase activator NlpD